ncbi:hypothetical protein [Deinococcus pimensis]|uniref:hypothetical protein n=1 Tax=Deinococcus pimensis TaxID=309888 RepID=UPI0004846823|nr:hypothetical protein [Deinococcus pimensis]
MITKLLRHLETRLPEDDLVREARRARDLARTLDVTWTPRAAWWRAELRAVDDLEVLLDTPFAWLTRRAELIAAYRRTAALDWKAEVALHEGAHASAGLLAGFAPSLSWTQGREEFPGGVTRATRHPGPSASLRFSWRGEQKRVVLGGGELGLDLVERTVAFGLAPRLLTLPGGRPLTLSAHDERTLERALRVVPVSDRETLVTRVEARLRSHPDFERGAHALATAMLERWPADLDAGAARDVFREARRTGPDAPPTVG